MGVKELKKSQPKEAWNQETLPTLALVKLDYKRMYEGLHSILSAQLMTRPSVVEKTQTKLVEWGGQHPQCKQERQ